MRFVQSGVGHPFVQTASLDGSLACQDLDYGFERALCNVTRVAIDHLRNLESFRALAWLEPIGKILVHENRRRRSQVFLEVPVREYPKASKPVRTSQVEQEEALVVFG